MEKAGPDLQSYRAVCLISSMGSLSVKAKVQSFFYVQHKAEHTVDAQEIALNLNQHRRRTRTRPHLHKDNCHVSWTPLGSFFYEVMVKVKGIHLHLEKLKDSNPT